MVSFRATMRFNEAYPPQLRTGIMSGLWRAATVVKYSAQAHAPVLYGTLRASAVVSTDLPSVNEIYGKLKPEMLRFKSNRGVYVRDLPGMASLTIPQMYNSLVQQQEPARISENTVYVSFNTPYAELQHKRHRTRSLYLSTPFETLKAKIPSITIETLRERRLVR